MEDQQRQKLDWITSGERRTAGTGYTRFVRAMRFILPLVAIALTIVIVLWDEMGTRLSEAEQKKFMPEVEEARGEMLNPQFDSVDSEGRPYTVTADKAEQDENNPKVMIMQNPDALIQMNEIEKLSGRAHSGLYEQEAGKLFLSGNVTLNHSAGYVLQGEELRVDLKAGQAFSDLPVHIESKMGTIDALGLEADNKTGAVIFKGPATLVLVNAGDAISTMGGQTP